MSKEQIQSKSESAVEKIGTKISPEKTDAEKAAEMKVESEKEVAGFESIEKTEMARAEQLVAGDESHSMHIDANDIAEMEESNQEVEAAQVELANEIGSNEISDDQKEKFGNFIKDKKEFYRENNMDVLKEAKYGRDGALKDAEYNKKHFEEYTIKVEELRSEIEHKKSSIITRVLEFRKIKELEKKLGAQKELQGTYERWTAQKKELADAYDYLIAEETKLSAIMEEAHKENAEWDENKRLEFIKEEDRRDVSKLAKEHGVFFVHNIVVADWKPRVNNRAIDTKSLNFNDQLDIIRGLDPTLAVSTLSPDSKNKTFGRASRGILFSGGRIIGGDESDAGTVANGLKDRNIAEHHKSTEAISEAIERPSKGKKDSESYNELVMENPEIAGVYFKWNDNYPSLKDGEDTFLRNNEVAGYGEWDGWWKDTEEMMQSGAPVFVVESDNNIRLVYDINLKERSFKVTPQYKPETMTDMPGIYQQHLGKEEKRKAAMRVFDKAIGLIPEDEQNKYMPDGTEKDAQNLHNIH